MDRASYQELVGLDSVLFAVSLTSCAISFLLPASVSPVPAAPAACPCLCTAPHSLQALSKCQAGACCGFPR